MNLNKWEINPMNETRLYLIYLGKPLLNPQEKSLREPVAEIQPNTPRGLRPLCPPSVLTSPTMQINQDSRCLILNYLKMITPPSSENLIYLRMSSRWHSSAI